jgi:hypothetical protein
VQARRPGAEQREAALLAARALEQRVERLARAGEGAVEHAAQHPVERPEVRHAGRWRGGGRQQDRVEDRGCPRHPEIEHCGVSQRVDAVEDRQVMAERTSRSRRWCASPSARWKSRSVATCSIGPCPAASAATAAMRAASA